MTRSRRRISLVALLALICGAAFSACSPETASVTPLASDDYLFCFWNVENLFDDHDDGRQNKADKEYDSWFAHDPGALNLKLSHLSEAIAGLNQGRGPDILAVAEVESIRAAELLRDALNKHLPDPSLHYTSVLMKNLAAGRHIAPVWRDSLCARRCAVPGNRPARRRAGMG